MKLSTTVWIYFNVPFQQREEAKINRLRWNPDMKKWYMKIWIDGSHDDFCSDFPWEMERPYSHNPFEKWEVNKITFMAPAILKK